MPNVAHSVTRIPVSIVGEWAEADAWLWKGLIVAEQPVHVLASIRVGGTVFWTKTPSAAREWPLSVRPRLCTYEGLKVQVHLSLGAANSSAWDDRAVTEFASLEKRPTISSEVHGNAGSPLIIGDWTCAPPVQISLTCFVASDVVMRRNRVWGIRSELIGELEESVRPALARGRRGSFEAQPSG